MRRPSSPSIDSAIQRVLESREGRRGIVELGKRISRSPTWIYKRARMLGLSQAEIARHWSVREEAIIRNSATLSDGAIQALLYKAGFCRSTMAIRIKLEKLRADRTNMDIMPAADVADFLGLARSSVDHWLEKGIVKGTQKSALGNWSVKRSDLRDFIIQNPIRINLKKVRDTEWFIDLLATRPKKKHRGESEDPEP